MDCENFATVYRNLADEESRSCFEARVKYALSGNLLSWWEYIHNFQRDYFGWDIEYLSDPHYQGKKIVIFGAGKYGSHAYYVLKHSSLSDRLTGFIDNNPSLGGGQLYGLPVVSPYELMKSADDYVVVIGSSAHGLTMYRQLCYMGFPQYNIYIPREGRLVGVTGHQYFDVFPPIHDEVFVDAGCYDGWTSRDFAEWCHGVYRHIYAFEPTSDMAEVCRKNFSTWGMKDVTLHQKVCWSSTGTVGFSVSTTRSASSVTSCEGNAEAISIDDVLNGSPVSFIKMDVEGSELEALKGAEASIRRYRPRLAISIYHKPEDIFEIPAYIISIHRDYQLYIRHYTSDIWETILYAI